MASSSSSSVTPPPPVKYVVIAFIHEDVAIFAQCIPLNSLPPHENPVSAFPIKLNDMSAGVGAGGVGSSEFWDSFSLQSHLVNGRDFTPTIGIDPRQPRPWFDTLIAGWDVSTGCPAIYYADTLHSSMAAFKYQNPFGFGPYFEDVKRHFTDWYANGTDKSIKDACDDVKLSITYGAYCGDIDCRSVVTVYVIGASGVNQVSREYLDPSDMLQPEMPVQPERPVQRARGRGTHGRGRGRGRGRAGAGDRDDDDQYDGLYACWD